MCYDDDDGDNDDDIVMAPKMGEEGVRNRIMSNEHEEECRWCR